MTPRYSPLKQSERIVVIDVLRGFAIFGILMVNMPLMYEPIASMLTGVAPDAPLHQVISESIIKFFFEGKFYVLFSMLFGYGFWIFLNKSSEGGNGIISVYSRRLFFLLLFGIAHVVLIWGGDILIFYAILGFILILFRNSKGRKIIKWAAWLSAFPIIFSFLMVSMFLIFHNIPEAKEAMEAGVQEGLKELEQLAASAAVIYSGGSFPDIVNMRITEYLTVVRGAIFFFLPVVLGMFLIGFWAARKGIVASYMDYLPFFRKMMWWTLGIGLISNTLYAIAYRQTILSIPDGWSFLSTLTHITGGIAFGLFYVSVVINLFAMEKADWLKKYLAPVGRMALTNYLMQSVIAVILFHPYGFGLFGRVEVWQGMLLTVAIYIIQIFFSRLWLNHYLYGPFEWLWRSLTYLRLQPLKRIGPV
jgi:uncharacterized protein